MSIEQAKEEVRKAQANLDKALASLKEEEEHKPQEGKYWISSGGIIECDFITSRPSKNHVKTYNQFNNEHTAKIAALECKIVRCLRQAADELCPDFVPDYTNRRQHKYYFYLDSMGAQLFSTTVFDTSTHAIEAGKRALPIMKELNELMGGGEI